MPLRPPGHSCVSRMVWAALLQIRPWRFGPPSPRDRWHPPGVAPLGVPSARLEPHHGSSPGCPLDDTHCDDLPRQLLIPSCIVKRRTTLSTPEYVPGVSRAEKQPKANRATSMLAVCFHIGRKLRRARVSGASRAIPGNSTPGLPGGISSWRGEAREAYVLSGRRCIP